MCLPRKRLTTRSAGQGSRVESTITPLCLSSLPVKYFDNSILAAELLTLQLIVRMPDLVVNRRDTNRIVRVKRAAIE